MVACASSLGLHIVYSADKKTMPGKKAKNAHQHIAIHENLNKVNGAGFDRLVLVATSPAAIAACQKDVQDL
jgi:hypothetical protein